MTFRNHEHYKKVRISLNESAKPSFNKSNWVIFLLAVILSVAIAPFLAARKNRVIILTFDNYLHQVTFFVIVGILIVLPLLWVVQFKPYLETRNGYLYIGRFSIKDKRQFLGLYYLKLFPGRRNWIKVSHKIFHSFKIGEAIELKRATLGSINSMRKVSSIRQRIKGEYLQYSEKC